jgi:hypothetical protein
MGSMSKRGSGRSILGWAIGSLFLGGLILLTHYSVGWDTLLTPWQRLRPPVVSWAVVLVVGSYAVRTVRIQEYFRPATSGGFLRAFRLVLLHNLFNNLLPMRTGEMSFPVLMARGFGVPYTRSVPGLVYLRVLDLHFVVLVGSVALVWSQGSGLWWMVLLLVPIPYLLFRAQGWLLLRVEGREGGTARTVGKLLDGLPSSGGLFWKTWLWTVINWSVKLMALAWILQAFTPMAYPSALVGSTTGELSSVLPVHGIAGAGTYEAGVMAGLLPLGVELEPGLRAAVNLHLFILGVAIMAGALAALIPSPSRELDESADDS